MPRVYKLRPMIMHDTSLWAKMMKEALIAALFLVVRAEIYRAFSDILLGL